ncbi:unnamed protein product [Owenia fusiformis]|uniref:Uncharacterized protein n=1 Tax=Owenia fusiformis TaxID=6347 RepID=A0A8J1XFL9_OWEFU|nr:unnamed protein product [Owenia fusiformis]
MKELTPLLGTSNWAHLLMSGEAAMKQQALLDARSSPTKHLPTKMYKYQRHIGRTELPQSLNFDPERTQQFNIKKCAGTQTAGTQTQFTTFPDGYQPTAPQALPQSSRLYVNPSYLPPPPLATTSYLTLPTATMTTTVTSHRRHSNDTPPLSPEALSPTGPLNLSMQNMQTNSNTDTHSQSEKNHRKSVITCAPLKDDITINTSRGITSVEFCDPDIEEHFRRSLGARYTEIRSKPSSPTPSGRTPSPTSVTSPSLHQVSISGSVDDHFKKALGENTWSKINHEQEDSLNMKMDSVDDHFAKALGTTWLKIKDKAGSGESSPSNSPPPTHSPPLSRPPPSGSHQTVLSV